jgi:CubicO group peptidase (beta-lactamase class C family)
MTEFEALDGFAARVLDAACRRRLPSRSPTRTARSRRVPTAPRRPDALWPIASIGKSFTAVVALQLAEGGLLDLHAPVTDYVPWLTIASPSGAVTLHHLLNHTAGVIETSDLAPASTYDVIALADAPTGFAPGEHRHYSDIGYRAVGVVLEAVTGQPYGELLRRRVLDRLGLRDTSPVMLHETRRRLPGGHVPFYDDRPWQHEHGLAPAPWVESAEADGCLCCSVEDLAAYLQSLWAGGELLSRSSLAAMKTPFPPHEGSDYGYGLEIHADGFGHGGDMLGYVAHMRAGTTARLGVVAFANGFGGAWWAGEGALAIAKGREPPDLYRETAEALVDGGSCPEDWAGYLARYRSHNPWLPTFLIAAREGTLVLGTDWVDGSWRAPLVPLDDGTFRVGEEPWLPERIAFDTVIDGRAQRASYRGTSYYRAFTG